MNTSFEASAWRNGSADKTVGITYGLRLGVEGRAFLDGKPGAIMLILGAKKIHVPVTDGFWRKCPEVRHAEIGAWFRTLRISLCWPKGKPHRFRMTKLGENTFRVEPL